MTKVWVYLVVLDILQDIPNPPRIIGIYQKEWRFGRDRGKLSEWINRRSCPKLAR